MDPTQLINTGVAWFLGTLGTLFVAFLAYHALKHLLTDRDRGIMPLLELIAIAVVAGVLIFHPAALHGLADGFVRLLHLPG